MIDLAKEGIPEETKREYTTLVLKARDASDRMNAYALRLLENWTSLSDERLVEMSREVEKLNLRVMELRRLFERPIAAV